MADFIFHTGPKGRNLLVDGNGRLIATGDPTGPFYPYSFGNTGRACVVDGSGRLVVNFSLISSAFETLTSASGISPPMTTAHNFYLPLEEDAVIDPPVPGVDGAKYLFVIKQSVGGKDISFNNVIWAEGAAPTLTQASGSIDAVMLVYVGPLATYMGDFRQNWS